jgi:endonuclease/exonuclease/phosphatase family metal-dependent hydrolase
MNSLVVANFNIHAGVNGWGQPFDVIEACRRINADVLVLEEVFGEDGQRSQAEEVAQALGYQRVEVRLGRTSVREVAPIASGPHSPSWGPNLRVRRFRSSLLPDPDANGASQSGHSDVRRRGQLLLAVLSRVPVQREQVLALPKLPGDTIARRAIVLELGDGAPISVIGTHLGHLSHGSFRQMRYLRQVLDEMAMPAVAIGDMNCWGPPLALALRGVRGVKGRTWPSRLPHSQIDHVICRNGAKPVAGEVLGPLGSDHRAIRATITW